MSTAADDAGVKYLLSLQVLLDLSGTSSNPAEKWANAMSTSRMRVSVITVAMAGSIVNGAQGPDGERHRARLADTLAKLNADGGAPLPFGEGAAAAWQSFVKETSLLGMNQVDRQLCATAFSEGLCLVEYDHPLSPALGPLGVKVHGLGIRL